MIFKRDIILAIIENFIINHIMSNREVLLAIHNFCELNSLANFYLYGIPIEIRYLFKSSNFLTFFTKVESKRIITLNHFSLLFQFIKYMFAAIKNFSKN